MKVADFDIFLSNPTKCPRTVNAWTSTRESIKFYARRREMRAIMMGRGRRRFRMTVAFGSQAAGGGIRRKATSETFAIRLTPEMCDLGRK
jgi:hypothetical protein